MHTSLIAADANRVVNLVYKRNRPRGLEVLRVIPHAITFQCPAGVDKPGWILTATNTVDGQLVYLEMEYIWTWSPE